MGDLEKAKRITVVVAWACFVLSFATLSIMLTKAISGTLSYIFLGAMILLFASNLTLSFSKPREKLSDQAFLVIISAYALISAVLIVLSGKIEELPTLSQNPFFLNFFLPILFTSIYYGVSGAVPTSFVIAVIDVITTIIYFKVVGENDISRAFNYSMMWRMTLYLVGAFIFSFSEEDKRKQAQQKRAKEEEFNRLIEGLKKKNTDIESEIKKVEKSRMDTDREFQKNSLLLELSKSLTNNLDLESVLYTTIKKIRELIVFHSAAAFIYDPDKTELIKTAGEGLYQEEMELSLRADIGIPYIVARTGKSLNLGDTSEDPRFRVITETAKVCSAVYIPIELESQVFGVLALWSMEKNAYSNEDVALLSSITREAARSIKNAELYRQLDTRLNFIVTLWETSKSLTSSLDLSSSWEKVLEDSLKTAGYLFNADKIIFFQYQKEFKELAPYICLNISDSTKSDLIIKIKQEPVVLSEFLRSNFQVKDLVNDPRFSSISSCAEKEGVKSMLWSPLIGRNRIIGALALFSTKKRTWASEEIQWLDIFTNMFSMTLENVMLLLDLFSEKNQLQALIDNVPEGVYTTDSNRRILTWNLAAEKITGVRGSDAIGSDCCRYIKCQNVEGELCPDKCPLTEVLKKRERIDLKLENMFIENRSGEKIPVFITAAPIFNDVESVTGTILVFRDITKEKEIERMKEEFLATITHDLKSPLASIMGYTELLLNPKLGSVTNNQKEFLDAILRSSKTLQILINNILESTRMEAGRTSFNSAMFNVKELVDEIDEMFRPLLAHKQLELKVNLEPSLNAYGDREKIREVYVNLLSNAVKFTSENDMISISGCKIDNHLEIRVSDTGKGIPDSEISKLFQKFSQVKGEKRGTGLGLYICRKILEGHGQTIRVESKAGEGTTFIFTLDACIPPEKTEEKPSVLIVEKDRPLAKMMERYFLEQRYSVFLASSMKEAKKILDDSILPGVLILDWHLPNKEAVRVMEIVRKNNKTEKLPILLLCDYREELSGDFDAVVNKPVNFRDLMIKANAFVKG